MCELLYIPEKNIQVIWDIMPRRLVNVSYRFAGACRLHLHIPVWNTYDTE